MLVKSQVAPAYILKGENGLLVELVEEKCGVDVSVFGRRDVDAKWDTEVGNFGRCAGLLLHRGDE